MIASLDHNPYRGDPWNSEEHLWSQLDWALEHAFTYPHLAYRYTTWVWQDAARMGHTDVADACSALLEILSADA